MEVSGKFWGVRSRWGTSLRDSHCVHETGWQALKRDSYRLVFGSVIMFLSLVCDRSRCCMLLWSALVLAELVLGRYTLFGNGSVGRWVL